MSRLVQRLDRYAARALFISYSVRFHHLVPAIQLGSPTVKTFLLAFFFSLLRQQKGAAIIIVL